MKHLIAFILRMLLDQRGEVGDDIEEIADDDVIEIDPDEPEDEEPEDDEPEPDKEPEKDFEAELAKKDELLKKQDETIKEHNRNLYGLRKKFKALETKTADKDTVFTDDQLKKMIEEHQDDPAVMLQIMKHVSKQTAGDETKSQVSAMELSNRKKDLDGYLTTHYPDAFNEGSQDHQDLQKAKEYLGLLDHPLGDYLAGSATVALQMPDMLENAKKEAKESAIKVEENRKKSIKETNLESGKKKSKGVKLSDNHLAVAKQLGLSKSATRYYKEMLNNTKPATVEV